MTRKILHQLRRRARHQATLAVTLLLAIVVAGVPELVEQVLDEEPTPCAAPCDLAGKDGSCSPVCHSGACARVVATMIPVVLAIETIELDAPEARPVATVGVMASSGVIDDVFHPPRV